MDSLGPVLIIAALIILNAVFVAAEFSIIGSSRLTVARLAREGQRRARLVEDILADARRQDRYIATAQLGITFASLGLGMYGEHVLAQWLIRAFEALGGAAVAAAHTVATVLSVAILTYLHIVLGEMIPKTLALMHPERTALRVGAPMGVVQLALLPAVVALNSTGNAILRLFGVRRVTATTALSPEEIQIIVEESQKAGAIQAEAAEVVHELFEFSELTAEEAMMPRVRIQGVPLGATPDALRTLLKRSRHTRYPVYEGDLDHIAGMVHIKDLLRLMLADEPVSRAAVRTVPFVPETMRLDRVLDTMRRENTQMVIVMDEHGGTAGLLTTEDLFEEVIGEIDEGPHAEQTIRSVEDGALIASGVARLDEIGEELEIELEHEEVDTVSGLVLMLLERPPEVGDVVEYGGVRIAVEAIANHGVDKCRVTLLPPPEEES